MLEIIQMSNLKISQWQICLLLLLLFPTAVNAQVYSLDSCVRMALDYNKRIEAARWQTKRYEHNRKALFANFFPNIKGSVSGLYSTMSRSATLDIASPWAWTMAEKVQSLAPRWISDNMKEQLAQRWTGKLSPLNPEIEMKVKGMFAANVQIEQPLYMGGKIKAGYEMGRIGEQMSQLGESVVREEVILKVYDAYQLMVKAKELHVVAQKYDSLLIQLTHDVEKAIEHGMASRNEKLKVQVKKNEAQLRILEAENGIVLARMNLCQLIGLPLSSDIDVETDEDLTTGDCSVDQLASHYDRTEAQILDRQVMLASQQVKIEKSAYRPEVGLGVMAGVVDGLEFLDRKFFRHKPVITAVLTVKVPIYHAGEVRHKVAAAKADLERQRLERADYLEKMDLELMQKANQVNETMRELQLREKYLEECGENLRISRKSYDVGLETLSDLLTAQVLWQEAYANRVETRYKLKSRWMEWRKAAGRLDPSSYTTNFDKQ